LGKETLAMIAQNFLREMKEGLGKHSHSSLKMIPTFVTKLPKGNEKGVAVAIDVGGSNLRVLKVTLERGQIDQTPLKKEIPPAVQQGPGEALFDFIAEAVKELAGDLEDAPLGYTFSFPINQTSINSGVLIKWTKGFSAGGVVDKDVVELLNKSLGKKGVKLRVSALINDTVGTQLAGCYQTENSFCFCGVILGTGANCCYLEKVENITKYSPTRSDLEAGRMIINMECGNFGSRLDRIGRDLPLTEFDYELDEKSSNKNNQLLEKQMSGMYLGEITRLILRKFIKAGVIFKAQDDKISAPYKFTTEEMSRIEADNTSDYSHVTSVLTGHGIRATFDEKKFVKDIVHLVARRSAQLASVQIAAIYQQFRSAFPSETSSPIIAAVDGSVFEKYPNYGTIMNDTLTDLIGPDKIRLVLAKDGSGNGAALASVAAKSN